MAEAIQLFPWQIAAWQQFCAWQPALSPLLLLNSEGLGEATLVRYLALTWQCLARHPDGSPCQHCTACQQVLADSEATTIIHSADSGDKSLGVDWVRQTVVRLQQKAPRKFLALLAAERLTLAASNALLKFLEEPPPNTAIIFSSGQPSRLLPTLRSRLRPWRFSRPPWPQVQAWLQSQHPDASALDLRCGFWLCGGDLLAEPPLPQQAFEFFAFLEICAQGSTEKWPLYRWQAALQGFSEATAVNFAWRLSALALLQPVNAFHQSMAAAAEKVTKAAAHRDDAILLELLPLLEKTAWPRLSAILTQKPRHKLLAFQDFLLHLAALRQQNVQKDLWWVNVALRFFELFREETT